MKLYTALQLSLGSIIIFMIAALAYKHNTINEKDLSNCKDIKITKVKTLDTTFNESIKTRIDYDGGTLIIHRATSFDNNTRICGDYIESRNHEFIRIH